MATAKPRRRSWWLRWAVKARALLQSTHRDSHLLQLHGAESWWSGSRSIIPRVALLRRLNPPLRKVLCQVQEPHWEDSEIVRLGLGTQVNARFPDPSEPRKEAHTSTKALLSLFMTQREGIKLALQDHYFKIITFCRILCTTKAKKTFFVNTHKHLPL